MSSKESEKVKKHICLGILAHVDAGKTTLSESMLYISGSIRKMGRVDHKDAFLDTYDLERSRGITIFSKQAVLSWKDMGDNSAGYTGACGFSLRRWSARCRCSTMQSLLLAEPMACRDTRGHSGGSCGTITFRLFCLSTRWICRGRTKKPCSSS